MTSQLHRYLLAIVAVNLTFVQITGAVSLAWMLPLFALTLAAPVLSPLQRRLSYRVLWNTVLMAIFALLLVDIRRSGIRFMLEDGLILAAFCQVHVLNNLGKQQKPDLIFFNSFLITLVTGFFCQDVVYCAVFLVYAVLLVIALGLASAGTVGHLPTRALPAVELQQLIRRSSRQAGAALLCTALVFMFWPRDFEREGLVETNLGRGGAVSEVGFADEIRLDHKTKVVKSNRVVMRVQLLRGAREHVSSYWRGATFTNLQRRGWWADTNPQGGRFQTTSSLDERWVRRSGGEFVRPGHELGASLAVNLSDSRLQSLFAPLEVNRARFSCTAWPLLDGNFRVTGSRRDELRYFIDVDPRGTPRRLTRAGHLAEHRRLYPHAVPSEARALNRQIDGILPDAPRQQRDVVEAIRRFLATQRDYLLPGEDGAAQRLRDFIAGRGGGHCEYFATTMIVLLRLRHIPCRMVGGFLAHEWNDAGTELIIRSKHAHAWVEVWEEGSGWITVDPTPSADADGAAGVSFLTDAHEFLASIWAAATRFDSDARARAMAFVVEKWHATLRYLREHPVTIGLGIATLLLLRLLLRARRRNKKDPAVRDYLGVLTRVGLSLDPGETPRQLLVRARESELNEKRLEALKLATARHEAARYS